MIWFLATACLSELPTAGSQAETCTYYLDDDGDGFGDPATKYEGLCVDGGLDLAEDCDDTDAAVFPGQYELCNGVDDDCDGRVDVDAVDGETWYPDADSDGWGVNDEGVISCTDPGDHVLEAGDCDDDNASANPSLFELCNGFDDDCDGVIDGKDALDPGTWYRDADGDGYGDGGDVAHSCDMPSGYADNMSDCYDGSAYAFPGQTDWFDVERGDGSFDYDCNGAADRVLTDFGSCDWGSTCVLQTHGWWEWSIPDCGEWGEVLDDCDGSWTCNETISTAIQSCR
ncbi:MAG: hypothetical protein GY913_35355 [Proteobacteria bacterium]|nr:hypothetical protein [Pseudomonadota bacterium]MCP4922209.1 hypothetical protein [Pseudomonadota bacterium]